MEIIIVAIVIGILAVVGVVMYDKMIEDAKAKACAANQDTILGALEIYVLENDQLPGSISQLNDTYIQRSFAKVMHRPGSWKTRLAMWLVKYDAKSLVYANTPASATRPAVFTATNNPPTTTVPTTTVPGTTTVPSLRDSGLIRDFNVLNCPASTGNRTGYVITDDAKAHMRNAAEFAAYNNADMAIIMDEEATHKTRLFNPEYYKVGVNKDSIFREGAVNDKINKNNGNHRGWGNPENPHHDGGGGPGCD